MSKDHTASGATVDNAQSNLADPTILNCTKVVRLFLLDPATGRTEDFIRANESPTRNDVFVDRTKLTQAGPKSAGDLTAMSLGSSALVTHEEAHHQHDGSILVLSADNGDQVEWQCDVPFRVKSIRIATGHTHFETHGTPPPYPFKKNVEALRQRERFAPIRSGALTGGHGHWKQLYKAEFELEIDGRKMILDPDVYCEGRP